MKLSATFLMIVMMPICVLAQNAVVDSLSGLLNQSKNDSDKVELLLHLGKQYSSIDLNKCLEYGEKAAKLSREIEYEKGHVQAVKLMGLAYYFKGEFANALIKWQEAEVLFSELSDTIGLANILSNIGAIYFDQGQYTKAIDFYLKSLSLAEKIKDTLRIGSVLQNIGAVHVSKGDIELALQAYQKVIPLFQNISYGEGIGLVYLNIAEIYERRDKEKVIENLMLARDHLKNTPYYGGLLCSIGKFFVGSSNLIEGMAYLDSAYQVASASGDRSELIVVLNTKANAYELSGDDAQALSYYERAKSMLLDMDIGNFDLRISAEGLVRLYFKKKDFKSAFENQQLLQIIKDSIYNLESNKKIDQLLFTFELEKKEDKIALLVKDGEIKAIELDRQKGIRNGFVGGFILVFLFAGVFFAQRNRISSEKKRSEVLLLNILPEEVAKELKEKGETDAQLIEQVTVLFTDFKGFTAMSEQVTPKELVADLHACFSEFDRICEKYGIEKIKTIGDAYMAAGGLPTPNNTHAEDVVKAALEMAEVVEMGKAKKIIEDLPFFEIRIGIHTGPVVAGIVGVKKFQYDIWGDTVNTASRLESNGEEGKVNISQTTYQLLKDHTIFTFKSRGKIMAKGKGEVEMWFVSMNSKTV